MTDFSKALDTMITDADWARMAKEADMPASDLKEKVMTELAAVFEGTADAGRVGNDVGNLEFTLGEAKESGECHTQEFEISLYKIIGLSGELTLCGTSMDDFSAELKFCLVVAGAKVWCASYSFDPHNLSVCFSPDVGAAKAQICFHLRPRGNSLCLAISGEACIWTIWWQCERFDETLFCIPI
jgi:hypothetical protein